MLERALMEAALGVLGKKTNHTAQWGTVACALRAANGRVYRGVCIDLRCSLGACAEQVAAGQMVTDGETRVNALVCLRQTAAGYEYLKPCGKCQEYLAQLDPANRETLVVCGEEAVERLGEGA